MAWIKLCRFRPPALVTPHLLGGFLWRNGLRCVPRAAHYFHRRTRSAKALYHFAFTQRGKGCFGTSHKVARQSPTGVFDCSVTVSTVFRSPSLLSKPNFLIWTWAESIGKNKDSPNEVRWIRHDSHLRSSDQPQSTSFRPFRNWEYS